MNFKQSKKKAFFIVLQILLIYCTAALVAISIPESIDFDSLFIRTITIATPFVVVLLITYKQR